jgi:K+:H+ antiporter
MALLAAARILADLMKRFGQAAVIGELLAGVLLGPTLFGSVAPAAYHLLFPPDLLAANLLEAFAWTGAVMLLLYVGLETDLDILRGMGRTAVTVSALGIAVPFVSGLVLGYFTPPQYLAAPGDRLIFPLFMAVAISISAVPVIAKILIDLGLMRRELGVLILAAGVVDDGAGWLLLSIVAGLAERGTIDLYAFGTVVVAAAAFVLFCYFAGIRIVARMLRWVDDRGFVEHAKFSLMVVVGLGCAVVAQAIGIHAVFGAFVAGLMMSRSARVRKTERLEVETVTNGFLAPLFFAYSGLRADLSAFADPSFPLIVLGVACAAKLIGCGLGGLLGRLDWRESLTVAFGMNARGGMGIVVALIGLDLGVLTPQMYTAIIFVAVVTSLIAPPLLSWSISGVRTRPSEAERMERERLLARLPFSHESAKLLVLSGGGPHAQLAAHLAAALGNHHDASITVFHARTARATNSDDFNAQFANIKSLADLCGARNVYQRVATTESIADAVAAESARGYDAIFAGASQLGGYDALGGEVLHKLLDAACAPIVIARGVGAAMPFRRVLVPTTGAAFSRLGALFAMLYARTAGAHVTTLYVSERQPIAIPGLRRSREPFGDGAEVVEDLKALGREFGVKVAGLIDSSSWPEDVILSALETHNCDLLVMGVLFRSAEQRLYFGPKVEQILRKARCAVAVVVPPQISATR